MTDYDEASRLGPWLEKEMKNRGWSYRKTERATGISKSVLEDIVKVPTFQPRPGILARLAETFSMPLWQIIELCGYPSGVSETPSHRAERIANLIRSRPWAEDVLNRLAGMEPDRVDAVLAVLEVLEV